MRLWGPVMGGPRREGTDLPEQRTHSAVPPVRTILSLQGETAGGNVGKASRAKEQACLEGVAVKIGDGGGGVGGQD